MVKCEIRLTQNGLLVAFYEGFVGIGCLIWGFFIEKIKYSHWILGCGMLFGVVLTCSVYFIKSYYVIIAVMVGFGVCRSIGIYYI